MKLTEFMGGQDVQRSLNLADNKCVNLYAVTDDSGSVSGFYSTPGLASYASAASPFSGIYTASNGRCFAVSGTILYEVTTGGVLTNRGTVTAGTVSRMSDNGIEMIIVNGTDGWLFTFATNALKKISVNTKDFTVTIASPAVFTTVADHGLVAGDAIQLTTTTGQNTVSGELTAMPSQDIASHSSSIVVSPDGLNAYISADSGFGVNGKIYQYTIDQNTGVLSPLSTPAFEIGGYILGYSSHDGASMKFSPDGSFLYVKALILGGLYPPNTIVILTRDADGLLTFIGTLPITLGSFAKITSFAMTDAGTSASFFMHVYTPTVGGVPESALMYQFQRNMTSGALTAYGAPTVSTVLATTSRMTITDDGVGVYLTGKKYAGATLTGHIQGYLRSTVTGTLTQLADILDTLNPLDAVIPADGLFVYVPDVINKTIRKYSRNVTTSVLTYVDNVSSGSGSAIVISKDNSTVYCACNDLLIYQYYRDATDGKLTAMTVPTIATDKLAINMAITASGKNLYAISRGTLPYDSKVMTYARQQSATSVGLPTGLDTLTTYYVIAAGLTAKNFEVSLTAGGAAVNTSGVQAGIHTYKTIGYGFPDGANTVSYIDGRFVVCEPNSQNFYVSDVLKGDAWDALNVQTADSNPDKIVGQVTLHNELVVFCEQSGETFYDSGTYPAPFVRNVSGIFEVGCIAPYSIAKIDNSVMWLGRSSTGQGIIYRLNGYTPVRLSTYAIEYAIQNMTTISDAQAFTYQQEGHHFYVITFPTGGRTFAFDVNTSLWHERAGWSGTALTRWAGQEYAYFDGKHLVCDYASGNIYSMDLGVYTDGANARKWIRSFSAPSSEMKRVIHNKLTLEAEVGVGSVISGGGVDSITMTNAGGSYPTLSANTDYPAGAGAKGIAISADGISVYVANDNANTVSMFSRNITTGVLSVKTDYATGTGPRSVSISPDGTSVYVTNYSSNTISMYARNITTGALSAKTDYATGANPFASAISPDGLFVYVANSGSATVSMYPRNITNGILSANTDYATGTGPLGVSISADGISLYVVNYSSDTISMYSRNITTGVLSTKTDYATGLRPTISTVTPDGMFVYVANDMGNSVSMFPRNITTGALSAKTDYATAAYPYGIAISPDGLSVFVTGGGADAISMHRRNTTTGVLSGKVDYSTGVGSLPYGVAISPDGLYIHVSTYFANSVSVFKSIFTGGTYALSFAGTGVNAAGTYDISATTGKITGTTITNAGSGYTSPPVVSFPLGGIIGAAGTANMTYTYQSPMVSLKYSNDGGHTWSADNWRDMSMGTLGQYSKRVYWYRLGMTTGQTRLYELSSTSPTKVALLGAYLE